MKGHSHGQTVQQPSNFTAQLHQDSDQPNTIGVWDGWMCHLSSAIRLEFDRLSSLDAVMSLALNVGTAVTIRFAPQTLDATKPMPMIKGIRFNVPVVKPQQACVSFRCLIGLPVR